LFQARFGRTDSELLFLLLLQMDMEDDFPSAVSSLIAALKGLILSAEISEPFRFTAAYADGDSVGGEVRFR